MASRPWVSSSALHFHSAPTISTTRGCRCGAPTPVFLHPAEMSSGDRDDLEAIVKLSGHIIMRPRSHMYRFMGGVGGVGEMSKWKWMFFETVKIRTGSVRRPTVAVVSLRRMVAVCPRTAAAAPSEKLSGSSCKIHINEFYSFVIAVQ